MPTAAFRGWDREGETPPNPAVSTITQLGTYSK